MSDSRWNILTEYSKSVITVAGAILGIGGAFFIQSQTLDVHISVFILIIVISITLFTAIVGALLVNAHITSIIKIEEQNKLAATTNPPGTQKSTDTIESKLAFSANMSYFTLGGSLLAMAAIPIILFFQNGKNGKKKIIDDAIETVVKYYKVSPDSIILHSLQYNSSANNYRITLYEQGYKKRSFDLSISKKDNQFYLIKQDSIIPTSQSDSVKIIE